MSHIFSHFTVHTDIYFKTMLENCYTHNTGCLI